MPEETSDKSRKEPKVGFDEVEEFFEKSEEELESEEEKVEEELEEEEKEIGSLEEKKEEIEKRKKEIDERIRNEKERVETLKKEEQSLKIAEKKAKELKEDIEEKGADIKKSVKKLDKIVEKGKKEAEWPKKSLIRRVYEDNYKILLAIPFLLLLFAFVQLSYQHSTTGAFMNKGIELMGGITLTLPEKSYDTDELKQVLSQELNADVNVRKISQTKGILIDASGVSEDELLTEVEKIFGELDPDRDYSIEQMGSSLGASFFGEITKSIIIAFILMAVVVLITFRLPLPSVVTVLAVMSDIIVTLAVFNLTGERLGSGGIAAFLMIIGYSVDTNILLNTKVLKIKTGTVMDRVYMALKTGAMMTVTTIAAIVIAIIFSGSEVIRQITTILLIALLVDVINTWVLNVGILRLYLERREKAVRK